MENFSLLQKLCFVCLFFVIPFSFVSSLTHSFNQVLEALYDHDYQEETLSVEEQLDAAGREIARLEEETQNLRSEPFHLQCFQCKPKLIMFYTRFKNYDTLIAVFLALKPTVESTVRLSQMQRLNQTEEHTMKAGFHAQHLCLFNQFLLFLCRVQQGFSL